MRIRIAILDKDQNYLNRLSEALGGKYPNKFQIYSFTDKNIAVDNLKNLKIDVLITDESFELDFSSISQKMGFAYLVEANDLESYKGQKVICKYQKIDTIYKEILNIYAETVDGSASFRTDGGQSTVVVFASPIGGVGTSSCAAACAKHIAKKNQNVLYLSLELFSSSDIFFSGEGKYNMSDIIYALKSRMSNLQLKLESCVKHDESGVCFYSQPKVALDMREIDVSDINKLIDELRQNSSYEYIIIDIDFGLDDVAIQVMEKSSVTVLISDGTDLSNNKLLRAMDSIGLIEQSKNINITNKISILYNKFSNKSGKTINNENLRDIGGAPKYLNAPIDQVIDELSKSTIFEQVYN